MLIRVNLRLAKLLFNMKFFAVLFAIVAAATAGFVAPSFYSAAPYAAYGAYPYAHAYAAPYAHAYSAPYAHAYAAAPVAAVPSGYVAQTPGALHVAPHPEGPFTASHHINTAPAPGTY